MLIEKVGNYFFLRSLPTASTIDLLSKTVLGSKGAKYTHLDVAERIEELDNPFYLTLEHRDKALANVTLCQRSSAWYLRFFAFDKQYQTQQTNRRKPGKESGFYKILDTFFENILTGKYESKPDYIYAYIDPKNDRSRQIANRFSFQTIGHVVTQTFSRAKAKSKCQLVQVENGEAQRIREMLLPQNTRTHFTPHYIDKCQHFVAYENNEIVAYGAIKHAHWIIERFPGIFGSILPKVIPRIPVLKHIIRPNDYRFMGIETVWVKDEDVKRLQDFYETICFHQGVPVIMWWCDVLDPIWIKMQNALKWGPLHFIIGAKKVELVAKSLQEKAISNESPYHVVAMDLM